jgi:hypothetical protein
LERLLKNYFQVVSRMITFIDRPPVCIGLVVMPEDLPLAYEVFVGNRADVTKYGVAERIWILDRGIVSEQNIEFLHARGARAQRSLPAL